jgi:hypothetical protein
LTSHGASILLANCLVTAMLQLEVTRVTAVSCGFWHTGFLTERQQVRALIRNVGGSQPLLRF